MQIIDTNEFTNFVVKTGNLCLVDFFATWCGPCKMLAPVLEEVERDSGVNVYKIDIDDEQELAINAKIMVVPTMLIFKDGKEVERFSGYMPKEEILKKLNKYTK